MPIFKPDAEKLRDRGDVAGLVKALRHRKPQVRFDAADTLGELKNPEAVEPLIAVLADDDPYVRKHAALALGNLGDSRAVEPLIAALLGAGDLEARVGAVNALGKLGDCRAVEPLIAALRDASKDHLHASAASALGNLGDPRAVEPLIAALAHESSDVRAVAVAALGELGDSRAVEPLIAALGDDSHTVMHWAEQALVALAVPAEEQQLRRYGGGRAIGLILKCVDPAEYRAVDLQPAIDELRLEGSKGSDRLAPLVHDFVNSRSEGIIYALQVAQHLQLTPALAQSVSEVIAASAVKNGLPYAFTPEISGRDVIGQSQIGWTDSTYSKAVTLAKEILGDRSSGGESGGEEESRKERSRQKEREGSQRRVAELRRRRGPLP